MINIYVDPEHYDLRLLGEISWVDDAYEFDLTAVWHSFGNRLYLAHDAGNSLCSPFEGLGPDDLDLVLSAGYLWYHLRRRNERHVRNGRRSRVEEIRALVRKAREATK